MQVAVYINNNSIFSTLHINTLSVSGGCAPRPLHLGSTTSAKKPFLKILATPLQDTAGASIILLITQAADAINFA